MHISLRISADGQHLEVKSISFDHNHDISEVINNFMQEYNALIFCFFMEHTICT